MSRNSPVPAFTEAHEPLPLTRREFWAWGALAVLVVATRVAVAPAELFEWDSANYELALADFDVFEHRPHPPGYPLFVALLRLARLVLPGTGAFVAVNAALGLGLLAALAGMVRPSLGRGGAFALAAAVAACPPLWMYGAASTAYVAEAFCAVGVGAVGLAVLRGRLGLTTAAVLWALLLGIRPNGVLTLGPLMAWVAAHRRREVPRALAAGAVACAGWFFPMAAESGGIGALREATSALGAWQLKAGSALSGDWRIAEENGVALATYGADALNVGLLLVLVLPLHLWRGLPWGGRGADRQGWLAAGPTLAFFAIWLAPSTVLYVVHHLPKAGYALTLVPGLAVVLALVARPVPRIGAAVAGTYVALNGVLFAVAVPYDAWRYKDAPELLPERIWMFGDYSARGLAYQTRPLRRLHRLLDAADPGRDAAVFLTGSQELHRLAMATRPRFELVSAYPEHALSFSTAGEETFGEWQIEVLLAPPLPGTEGRRSRVSWDGRTLSIERDGRSATRPLRAERLLVVVPCAPCDIDVAGPARARDRVVLGAGFAARWLEAPEDTPLPAMVMPPAPVIDRAAGDG